MFAPREDPSEIIISHPRSLRDHPKVTQLPLPLKMLHYIYIYMWVFFLSLINEERLIKRSIKSCLWHRIQCGCSSIKLMNERNVNDDSMVLKIISHYA